MANFKTEFSLLPEGRFAWVYLDQPRTHDMNGKPLEVPKFETMFYLPKTHPDPRQCRNYAMLWGKVAEVLGAAFRGDWPLKSRTGEWEEFPIVDCDLDAADLEKYPWGKGGWKIKLSGGKYRPTVVDAGNNEIGLGVDGKFRPGTFKSGDYGIVSFNAYEWHYGNRAGVSFGLEGAKKTNEGESIGGGGRSAAAMFGAPTGQLVDAPALPPGPAYAPPSAGYAPPSAGYAPPSAGYAPPSAGYAPPSAGYAPPPQPVYGGAPPAYAPQGAPQPGYGGPPAPGPAYAPPSAGYAPPPNYPPQAGPVPGGMPPAPPYAGGPPIGTR